jgi:predicted HTH domain antitoxin
MASTTETLPFPASTPENFESAVHMTRRELDYHLRLMAALKMFELGQISSGKAAELAGMSRIDFFQTCSRYRVSIINWQPEDFERELRRDLESLSQQ